MILNGQFYSAKSKQAGYSDELKNCIENTVSDLLINETSPKRPGMLLGKVQAGKTFAYTGIIALCFDNDFDIVVVLTKGTKFLLTQTLIRMNNEFQYFIRESDTIEVFDIMRLPSLTGYQQMKKLILLVKKEDDNLKRLIKTFNTTYPHFKDRRTLIIDDEADFASIGFRHTREQGLKINTTTRLLSQLRNKISDCDYLQVTATPYSLYLQPDDYEPNNIEIAPMRPAFTHLVPTHDKYIGADHFYGDLSTDNIFTRLMGYPHISNAELRVLNNINSINLYKDYNYAKYYLSNNGVPTLWGAILAFVTGGVLRRLQETKKGKKIPKYAFIIHTDTRKDRHDWQYKIVESILDNLADIAKKQPKFFDRFVKYFYDEFVEGLTDVESLPLFEEVNQEVNQILVKGFIGTYQVNSDNDAESLLDFETGQLKLINPLNIYIGGYIFDRGVTIDNMIGFYYCRSPRAYQQDTVIQHQRIFGARSMDDLIVTKFYTSIQIYQTLKRMHEFDANLWKFISVYGTKTPMHFIGLSNNMIRPCSPNKILLSNINTIYPGKRILPTGFQTIEKKKQLEITSEIDNYIHEKLVNLNKEGNAYVADLEIIEPLIETIWQSFVFENGYNFKIEEVKGIIEYLINESPNHLKKLAVIIRENRDIARIRKSTGRFEDAPDTGSGSSSELQIARQLSNESVVVILLRENGKESGGWKGSPFYWPIIIVPQYVTTFIYSEIK
jgi:predicted nucleic-acid-binding protein